MVHILTFAAKPTKKGPQQLRINGWWALFSAVFLPAVPQYHDPVFPQFDLDLSQ